jgi:nucleotide-binding universal stress UspA family protein
LTAQNGPFGPHPRDLGPSSLGAGTLILESASGDEPPLRDCADPHRRSTMKRILLAYDGSEPAVRALETAVELATKFGAFVGVISVVPIRTMTMGVDPWDDRTVHEDELRDAQERLRQQGIEPELIEPYGDPAWTIERIAAERDFDTIVIGSRGQGALGRFFAGSVSEHVATHSDATVIVTH